MKNLSPSLLQEVVQRIVRHVHPIRIYLYGSHAYGNSHEDSDIDLLVVVKDSLVPARKGAASLYSALRGMFLPIEVKVDTEEEFQSRANWMSSVERVIRRKGRILYESPA